MNNISNLVSQLPFKEITFFKYYKKQTKHSFKVFSKYCTTSIQCITIPKNQKFLFSGGYDGVLRAWDPIHLTLIKSLFFHQSCILCLDVDSNSKLLLSCSHDTLVCLWDINKLRYTATYGGHKSSVTCVKFVNNRSSFISLSNDQTMRIWDLLTGNLISIFNANFELKNIFLIRKPEVLLIGSNSISKFDLIKRIFIKLHN